MFDFGQMKRAPRTKGPWKIARFLKGIDLSDEQVERLSELKHSSFARIGHARIDIMNLRHELMKELSASEINESRVLQIKGEIKECKSQLTDLMVDSMLALAKLLTPEQRKDVKIRTLRELLGSFDEEMEDHHPGHMGHSHGPHESQAPPHR